jgi:hypothetical protein
VVDGAGEDVGVDVGVDVAEPGSGVEGVGGVDPAAPGCVAVVSCAVAGSSAAESGAAGGGEASWGADTAARLAGRAVSGSSGARAAAIPQAISTITVIAEPTATQRRLQ